MTIVRPMPTVFVIVALTASHAFSEDQPAARAPQGSESFEGLDQEYKDALKAWSAEYRAAYEQAKKDGTVQNFKFAKPHPAEQFSPRFLAIVEKNPEGPQAVDALRTTLVTNYITTARRAGAGLKPGPEVETRARALRIMRDYHVTRPSIQEILSVLRLFDEEDCKSALNDVIARNPDRKIQAAACKAQLASCERLIRFAELAASDPTRLEAIEKQQGKDYTKLRLARAEKARTELEGLKKALREQYAEYSVDLSIGRPVPEVVSQDLEGKQTRLSALKGKVVVLDVWATWCGPCRAMIPHEREMVERLKGKPFELVSISIDDELKTLTGFLSKENMPWTHWWNGPGGWKVGIAEAWDIHAIPQIFVLDAHGIIRYTNVRGEELEKAVNELLKEAEATTAG